MATQSLNPLVILLGTVLAGALVAVALLGRELLQGRTRVRSLGRSMRAAQDRRDVAEGQVGDLTRSNIELEQFANIAAHELKEPLRMVSSYTQLLARRYEGKLDDDADEFIHYAVEGANRMKALVDGLLMYARVRGDELEPAPTELEDVLRSALADLDDAVERSGAEITHDALPAVQGDARMLVQVIENMIGNAIKFAGAEPPRLRISAERRDSRWRIGIHDNGVGIEAEQLERVFELFRRLRPKGETAGVGIGLAVCKKIVELHGGRIWVDSTPGEGSSFFFTLPVATGGESDEP